MATAVEFKRLLIRNIDQRVTSSDLTKLLGFDTTDVLRKYSCIQIQDDAIGKYAIAICPSTVHSEALKLDGIVFFEQKLQVTDADAQSYAEHVEKNTGGISQTAVDEEGAILWMLLDLRHIPEFNFPPVREVEVCDALQVDLAEDPHIGIITFRDLELGTFGIESKNIDRYVDKSVVIRGKSIKLIPMRKTQRPPRQSFRDPDGIKIRIFNAYRMKFRSLSSDLFDEYFEKLGVHVVKSTQPERCLENRNFFNSNRFIVVKKFNQKGEEVDFGERITISGITFNLSYFGIQKWCPECERKHGWDCPTKVRAKYLRELRKGKTEKTKLYSDSTLRRANQLALRTDVSCMTGGGIAQICNMIPYDRHHDEVVINAGTNELRTQSLQEFAYTIQKAAEKLRQLSTTRDVTIVLPPITTSTPETIAKSAYLRRSIEEIDTIKKIHMENIEYDETDHPSVLGTSEMLKQIDGAMAEKIILEGCVDDIVSKRKYRHVQTNFKVGCRGCESLDYTPSLCMNCKESALQVDVTELERVIGNLKQLMFPTINESNDDDVEMQTRNNKRGNDDNEGNDESTNPVKAAKGGD